MCCVTDQNEFKVPMRPDNIFVETGWENLKVVSKIFLCDPGGHRIPNFRRTQSGDVHISMDPHPHPFGNGFKEKSTMT